MRTISTSSYCPTNCLESGGPVLSEAHGINKAMQRQRDGLVPVGEVIADLPGPVKAIREASPQALHHFTRFGPGESACRGQRSGPRSRFHGAAAGAVQPAPHQPRQPASVCSLQRPVHLSHERRRPSQAALRQLPPSVVGPGSRPKRCALSPAPVIIGSGQENWDAAEPRPGRFRQGESRTQRSASRHRGNADWRRLAA